MGWKLKSESDGQVFNLYVTNQDLVIGRKGCDFVIDNQAVSRRHAALTLSHPSENIKHPNKIPIIKINDLGSKYGTYINGEYLGEGGRILQSEDLIMLGEKDNSVKYRVIYEPMIVTPSCLTTPERLELMKMLQEIGGHCVGDWRNDCTHLVMNQVKVTIKAACAMINLKPLVTLKYFTDYLSKLKSKENLPNFENYVPKSGEIVLENISFDINIERENVFQQKTFLFLSDEQYKKMLMLLSSGGARAILMDKKCLQNYAEQMLMKDVCVIKNLGSINNDPELENAYKRVETILKGANKRPIPESDIALAVVHCSTEVYCNPDIDSDGNFVRVQSQTMNQSLNLANESKESFRTIPETLFSNQSSNPPSLVKVEPRETLVKRIRESGGVDLEEPVAKSTRMDTVPLEPEEVPQFPVRVKPEPVSQTERVNNFDNDPTQPMSPDLFEVEDESSDVETERPPVKKQRLDLNQDGEGNNLNKQKAHDRDIEAERANKKARIDHDDEEVEDEDEVLEHINVPTGFLSSKQRRIQYKKKKIHEEKVENDENVEPIRVNQLGTKLVSLVIRQPGYSSNVTPNPNPNNNNPSVKNFKKFKKVPYVGANRLPRIIGLDDLQPFNPKKGEGLNHDPYQESHLDALTKDDGDGDEPQIGNWMDAADKVNQDGEVTANANAKTDRIINSSQRWI